VAVLAIPVHDTNGEEIGAFITSNTDAFIFAAHDALEREPVVHLPHMLLHCPLAKILDVWVGDVGDGIPWKNSGHNNGCNMCINTNSYEEEEAGSHRLSFGGNSCNRLLGSRLVCLLFVVMDLMVGKIGPFK
jgi:hypothetical protein